jgi:hypothetical protein
MCENGIGNEKRNEKESISKIIEVMAYSSQQLKAQKIIGVNVMKKISEMAAKK